ncbi:MAG: CPBP family intramembrane glutamic endopeptidase [Flectobacillus sp.]|uniref:CPBP family intramembrane glutamic endopeptidase n=1 Tax=Flectobacillus sp. TaxID=50419 RepID=UPI003B99736F
MAQFDTFSSQTDRPLFAKVLILFGLTLVFLAVGSAIGLAIFSSMTGVPLAQFATFQANPDRYPDAWYAMMLLQTLSTPLPFIFSALIFWKYVEKTKINQWFLRQPNVLVWVMVLVLVISFMPFDSLFIEWNKSIQLPSALRGLEQSMQESEEAAKKITLYFTDFKSFPQFLVAMIVVAGTAAISEELLFRGVLQNILLKQWRNPHLAIWVAAFWFSFIHFQFYGLIPRMLLGAMFGYLYYWSGSLSLPIWAHFVNNGFTILMSYLYKIGVLKVNIVETDSVPLAIALASALVSVVIFRKIYQDTALKIESRLGGES